ncbi:hypothetical protein NQD34_007782 [Periophthalmus magnuspinnatus]|nr:hypothetical protein NQD34_007782 [Periophthalmus magnuspinnatus]
MLLALRQQRQLSSQTSPVPKTLSESYLTASPRPALRPDQALNQQLPDESKTRLGSRSEEEEERKEEVAGERYAYENGERGEEEKAVWVRDGGQRGDGVSGDGESDGGEEERESEGEGITEEQPPWENKTLKLQAKEFVASSTDEEDEAPAAESEAQKIESLTPDEREEKDQDSQLAPIETEPGAPESEETPVLPTAEKTKKTWSYYSLLLRCLFPLLLLLLGGFSQHLWLYGLPHSVAQLSAQLHLHWLEGIVPKTAHCSSDCRASLVESLPVGLYPSAPAPHDSIAQSWLRLLDRANHSVDIAAFYLTLRSKDQEPTDAQGRLVFEKLKSLKAKGVTLRLSVNAPQSQTGDTDELEDKVDKFVCLSGAEVREVHMSSLTGGIIHTKLWAVDQRHLYVGSANMDWRSLTQVKEVGLTVEDCSCLSQDLSRVFEVYWTVGGANGSLPPYWPARLSALSSSQNPLHLKFNGVPARVYLSSSPPQLSTRGRTDDLAAILSVIEDAQYFIHVSVMDFLPLAQFSQPPRFWPPLDSALRAAACSRGLKIRLLVSCWPYSQAAMFVYLQSLLTLNRPPLNCDIQVKVFTVPSTMEQMKIQFARVNHAKFMVTDRVLYIGTSNWSEDYFTQTAGVGLVVNQTGSEPGLKTLRTQADQIFLRDWTSQYSTDLTTDQTDACPQAQR